MPLELNYSKEKRILYVSINGTLSIPEFNSAMQKIVSSQEYPPDVATLWDIRAVGLKLETESPQTSATERQFLLAMVDVRTRYPERGKAKLAIVVPSEFTYGMSRMYEMLSDHLPQSIMVFRDLSSAETWLLVG